MAQDDRRVGDHVVPVDEHGHERLPAHRDHSAAVVSRHVDPFHLEPLVRECERDPSQFVEKGTR